MVIKLWEEVLEALFVFLWVEEVHFWTWGQGAAEACRAVMKMLQLQRAALCSGVRLEVVADVECYQMVLCWGLRQVEVVLQAQACQLVAEWV